METKDQKKKTLVRNNIEKTVSEENGIPIEKAKIIVDAFFDEITTALARGEPVKLIDFGNFRLLDKKERIGHHPSTGEEIQIPARRVVSFSPCDKIRQIVS